MIAAVLTVALVTAQLAGQLRVPDIRMSFRFAVAARGGEN